MKPGTIIKLSDGRIGTVIYNGLVGVGIKWGEYRKSDSEWEDIFEGTNAEFPAAKDLSDWEWEPDAFLRKPEMTNRLGKECVGEEYDAIA